MPDVSCAREGDPVNRTQFRYNAPLDGMRGVLMVFFMLYHFGVGVFSGAWVSINTFFVLSGFLITRLLVEEHARTGRIRVWEFYKRRARRLLPALFLLLTTIAGYAAFVAPESARRVLGGDILATLGYVINWRLIARADEYFGTAGGPSPLRHAWTLSIEEQFYVLVPFLIGAVVLLARRRRSQAMIVLALAGIGALWGAHLGLHDVADHARVYYGTDARAQSLFVGAALGLWRSVTPRGRLRRALPQSVVRVAGVVGVGATVISMFWIDELTKWMFNSGGILLFTLGSAALTLACADSRPSVVRTVLGWRPFAYAGRLSYGLYLWHWPIHLAAVELLPERPVIAGAWSFVLTFVFTAASYELVERRVIKNGIRGLLPRTQHPAIVAATPALALALVGVLFLQSTPPPPVVIPQTVVATPELVPGQPTYVAGEPARLGAYGDSVALFMAQRFPQPNWPNTRVTNLAHEGCDFLDEPMSWLPDTEQTNDPACIELKKTWPQRLKASDTQVLLVFSTVLLTIPHMVDGDRIWYDDPRYPAVIRRRLDLIWARAQKAGAEQLQLLTVPCRDFNAGSLREDYQDAFREQAKLIAEFQTPVKTNALLRAWAKDTPGIKVIDLDTMICANNFPRERNGAAVFNDNLHFSPEFTPMLWNWILGQVSVNWAARDR